MVFTKWNVKEFMMAFNDGNPIVTNTLASDIPDMQENTDYLKDVMEAITGGWSNTSVANIVPGNKGMFNRAMFSFNTSTSIKISPATYHHDGTTNQMVYWDSEITHTVINYSSGNFTYIYLDDSDIVTASSNVISASEIKDSTTAPTWSDANHGWYNGDDRCIFACYCDSAATIADFYHNGRKVLHDDVIEVQDLAALSSSWTDVTCKSPSFSRMSILQCSSLGNATGNSTTYIRPNGSSATYGTTIGRGTAFNPIESSLTHFDVVTDSAQKVETKYVTSKPSAYSLSSIGWYLPHGI